MNSPVDPANPSVERKSPSVDRKTPFVESAENPTVAANNPSADHLTSLSGLKRLQHKQRGGTRPRPQINVADLWQPVQTQPTHTLSGAYAHWQTVFPEGRHDPSVRQRIAFWMDHLGPEIQLSDINEVQVRRLADALNVSNATRNRYVAALGSLYRHARDKNGPLAPAYIGPTPTKGVHYDEESTKRRKTALTQAEIDGLLAASLRSGWDRMRLFVLISLTTGMRRSNVLWLRWRDIDPETGIMMAGAKPGREYDPTKNRSPFATALDQEVARESARFRGAPEDLVFPNTASGDKPRCVDALFKDALRLAGLRQAISPHWLRHTAATIIARNGASESKLMRVMGWKSNQMAKTYVHLNVEDIRADVGAIGKIVSRKG